ncbi:hypothetical protein ES705_25389 [subsurface metagenome]
MLISRPILIASSWLRSAADFLCALYVPNTAVFGSTFGYISPVSISCADIPPSMLYHTRTFLPTISSGTPNVSPLILIVQYASTVRIWCDAVTRARICFGGSSRSCSRDISCHRANLALTVPSCFSQLCPTSQLYARSFNSSIVDAGE